MVRCFQILICRGDGKSDIPPAAEWYYRKSDSDIKAYGFSAILFATLTCAANITAEGNNTAPRQYHSPQANRTAHFQCAKLQFIFGFLFPLTQLLTYFLLAEESFGFCLFPLTFLFALCSCHC